jgi:hypothetical protein
VCSSFSLSSQRRENRHELELGRSALCGLLSRFNGWLCFFVVRSPPYILCSLPALSRPLSLFLSFSLSLSLSLSSHSYSHSRTLTLTLFLSLSLSFFFCIPHRCDCSLFCVLLFVRRSCQVIRISSPTLSEKDCLRYSAPRDQACTRSRLRSHQANVKSRSSRRCWRRWSSFASVMDRFLCYSLCCLF